MVVALVQSIACKFLIALSAMELDDTSKKLPEEVPPRDLLGSETQHKLVELEAFVSDVRSRDLSVGIHENLTFLTGLPPALAQCKE